MVLLAWSASIRWVFRRSFFDDPCGAAQVVRKGVTFYPAELADPLTWGYDY